MEVPTNLLNQKERGCLQVIWPDERKVDLPFHGLRCACTCAQCVHEITGEQLLDPATVPDDIHIQSMNLVGNYALKIYWSDGHDTGLYTWRRFAELCAGD